MGTMQSRWERGLQKGAKRGLPAHAVGGSPLDRHVGWTLSCSGFLYGFSGPSALCTEHTVTCLLKCTRSHGHFLFTVVAPLCLVGEAVYAPSPGAGRFSSFSNSCLSCLCHQKTKSCKNKNYYISKHFTAPRAESQECNRYLINNS